MDHILHRPASVGGLTKKILSINPALGVPEIVAIVREASQRRADGIGEYGSTEVVDEARALELARRSLAVPGGRVGARGESMDGRDL